MIVLLVVFLVLPMLGIMRSPFPVGSSASSSPNVSAETEPEEPPYGDGYTFEQLDFPTPAQPDGNGYDCHSYTAGFADLGPRGYEHSNNCHWRSTDKAIREWEHGDEIRLLSIHTNAPVGSVAYMYNMGLKSSRIPAGATLYEIPVGEHGYTYFEEKTDSLDMEVVFTDGTEIVEISLSGHTWDLEDDNIGYTRATQEELTAEMAAIIDVMHS